MLRSSPPVTFPTELVGFSSGRFAAMHVCTHCLSRRRIVVQVYFHCSNTRGVLIDGTGASVGDMTDARDHAARVVRSLITAANAEDWRDWVLHVSDDLG